MTRSPGHNTRAGRRAQREQQAITIAGLRVEHQRAIQKVASTSAHLRQRERDLEALRNSQSEAIGSAMQLVAMVRKECIANPPLTRHMILRPDADQLHYTRRMLVDFADSPATAPVALKAMSDTLRVLRTKATRTTLQTRFDTMVHLRATLAGGEVGYAISEEALRHGDDDMLLERISEEMARQLLPQIQQLLRRKSDGFGGGPRFY